MATITYQCDTCKREITVPENTQGVTVFSKCIITRGCKGQLYKLERNKNILRSSEIIPEPVPGLENYVPRRVIFEQNQNISANPWKVNHNLGVSPAVIVYFFDDVTGRPFEVAPDDYTVTVVDRNNIEIAFSIPRRGIVQLIARSSVPREIETISTDNLFQVSNEGIMTLAVPSVSVNPAYVPTATPGLTPTPTPTISLTPSITVSPTVTPTISPTTSPTPSLTPSTGFTGSPTPTATLAPTSSSTLTPTPTPTPSQSPDSVEQKWVFDDNLTINVEVLLPSNPSEQAIGNYIIDRPVNSSPWFGWDQVLLRKRRNYSVKSFNILDAINDVFPEIQSLSDIPNGTSFSFTEINLGFGLRTIESRQLFVLLGREPYGISDKIRDRIIDAGELRILQNGRFFVFDGEIFVDESVIERLYPLIEETESTNLLASPTPTPTFTPTNTVTQTPTPTPTTTVTPSITPTISGTPEVTPSVTPTGGVTPTPTRTASITPTRTPSATVTPTPTVTPSPSAAGVNITNITVSISGPSSGDLEGTIRFRSDGVLDIDSGAGFVPRFLQWWTAGSTGGIGSNYSVRLVQNGAGISVPSGPALNTWHSLSSNRTWSSNAIPLGNIFYFTGEVSIRDDATLTVVDTASVTLLVDNTP